MATTATSQPQNRLLPLDLLTRRRSVRVQPAAFPVPSAVKRGLAALGTYAFATVDFPGAAWSFLADTNGTTAVGYFFMDPHSSSVATAFTFKGGVYRVLSVPTATMSFALSINTAGAIVGTYYDATGKSRGFKISGSTLTSIAFPHATETQAIGINDAGKIVGTYTDAANAAHGFLYSGGTYTTIDFPHATGTTVTGINAHDDIVGGYPDANGARGFVRRAGVFTPIDFPLTNVTITWGINDAGDVAGYYYDANGVDHGFILSGGTFSAVEVAGARGTQLMRIKNSGQVTGACACALGGVQGVIGQ